MPSPRLRRLSARRITRPTFSNRFSFRYLSPLLLVIAFSLALGTVLVSGVGTVTATLRGYLSSSGAFSLDRKLAAQFPVLAESMSAQATVFDKATRRVGGREVAGLMARRGETGAAAKDAGSSGNAGGTQAGIKPVEQEALRLMAERDGGGGAGEFKAFYPEQYAEAFVVEGGGVSAALRPLGALASQASVENGKVVYRGAYRETDSLHALGANRSEEFLYLKSKDAPRRFDYELSDIKGASEVKVEGGAVHFKNEAGRGVQIEAPWVVDAGGKRREDVVRWELAEAGADGKRVLSLVVAQGAELSYPLVIDPSWNTTGSLATIRHQHTATLLSNGKVLIAGGAGNGRLASAELYDPATGTWSNTGSLTTARNYHTATLLPNGKVLVAGGIGNGFLDSAELYDPALGTWSNTGSLATTRSQHTATLLSNGKVLVAGGYGNSGLTTSAELYDPALGTWSNTGSLTTARYVHTATLLPNGKVLVAGGGGYNGVLASAELYDPALGTWSNTGSLTSALEDHTATLLPNGKVLVAGGFNGGTFDSAELYDPALGTWSNTGSLAAARHGHTATLLPNGKVLVVGGIGNGWLASAELYDPALGTWSNTGSLTTGRYEHTATLLPNGKVLVAGGTGTNEYILASAELYDPALGTWSNTGSLTTARYQHTATLLPNEKVLVAGGVGYNGRLASAELYDPALGTWSNTGSLTTIRHLHTATLLPNGKVLVAGGVGYNGGALASAELYDPALGTWSNTGSLTTARYQHTATLLPNGKVLVAGGGGNGFFASAELYNPTDGTWSNTGSLTTARYQHTATLLPNGKVLVAGGGGNGYLNSAELYDPALGTWSTTGSLAKARYEYTATLLPNGKVLVAGGNADYGTPIASAELYDVGLGFVASSQPVITTATSPLQLTTKLTLTGTRFQGVSGSSSDNTNNSATNYPVVQLLSLANEQTRFLLSDPTTNWSDTSFTSQAVTGFPRGYALVTVFANGIPSDAKLIQVTGLTTSFSNLSAPTITNGDTPTILSGTISAGANFPTGNVSITLNGVTQQAVIQVDGTFSSSFATGSLTPASSPYTITYSFAGDSTYESVTDTSKTLTVNKATPTITWSNPTDITYGTALSATQLNATANVPGTFSYTPASGTILNAGSNQNLHVDFTPTDTANYNTASKDVSINVLKASQTITFGALSNKTFGDPQFNVSATASSGLAVSFSSQTTSVCTVSGNTVTILAAGTCTIRASQAGDSNYNAAANVDQSFTVAKANQTIAFNALADKTFGDADFSVSATASSGLTVSFASSGQCTVTGNTVHITGAGSCTITASQAGDSNYNAAANVDRSFTVAKANQTITFNALSNKTFGDADFSVSATASSGLSVSFGATGNCTVSGNTVHITGAGSCTITASQGGDSNYNAAANVDRLFTVAKANQTITVGTHAPASAAYNSQFTVAATSNSGLAVSYSSSGVCTNTGATFTMTSGTGTCTVKYDQAGNGNYNAATQVTESVTAQKANQTITFGALANKTFGDADFSVSATASSGLSVSFSATGNCTVSGNTVHITGAGSCTITASQGGDSNYNAAANVDRLFTIAKANQTITFNALANKTFGDADFGVNATASSGLSVTFAATGQCTVTSNGSTVHITGAGSCTITASQAGNSNYNAATPVPQSFNIAKAATTTAVSSSINPSQLGQNVTFTATVTSTAGTPTGKVTFKDGVSAIATCSNLDLVAGVAACTTSSLTLGNHAITADYNGDSNFNTSTGTLSGGQQVNVNAAISISDVSLTEGNSGTKSFDFTVTLSQASNLTVKVDFATAPGTATAGTDYQSQSGTLTFNPGELTKTIAILVNGDTQNESNETFFVNLTNPVNATISDNQGQGTIQNDDATQLQTQLQLSASGYTVGEAAGRATITVNRTGDTSQAASVDYATSDLSGLNNCDVVTGNASQRCDYTGVRGTVNFIAGQTSATFTIPIINDVFVEGPETLTLALSNPVGGALGSTSTATLSITDNDNSAGAPNPIDQTPFFAREQYLDFLNREPEEPFYTQWQNILNNCPAGDTSCDRIGVSIGFFRSREFFDRAYYVFRFYEAALGRKPTYAEYQQDIRRVTGFLTDAELEARKAAFAEEFVRRAEFKALYDSKLDGDDYVNAIVATAGVIPSNRTSVAIREGALAITRGQALRELVESPEIGQRFYNEAFVVVGYFAYLRRDPDAQYLVWLDQLNNPPANRTYQDIYREMIRGFIESQEYRHRFGPN